MWNKIISSVFVVVAPLAAVLLCFVFFQFRLIYLTEDKGREYHIAVIFKMISAILLIGFIDVTNFILWSGFMVYFGSDAYLAYNRYKSRTNQLVAEAARPGGKPFVGMFNERYVFYFAPVILGCLVSIMFSYNRLNLQHQQQVTEQRFEKAERTRTYTARKVTTIADRATQFIDLAIAFFNYQVRANYVRDYRIREIENRLGIAPDTLTAPMPDKLKFLNETDQK